MYASVLGKGGVDCLCLVAKRISLTKILGLSKTWLDFKSKANGGVPSPTGRIKPSNNVLISASRLDTKSLGRVDIVRMQGDRVADPASPLARREDAYIDILEALVSWVHSNKLLKLESWEGG